MISQFPDPGYLVCDEQTLGSIHASSLTKMTFTVVAGLGSGSSQIEAQRVLVGLTQEVRCLDARAAILDWFRSLKVKAFSNT